MPSSDASGVRVKDIVLFPIRFRTEGAPGSSKQGRTSAAPTTNGQIFKIKFAVIRIPRRLQRANRVEAFDQCISPRTLGRQIDEPNPRGIGSFEVLPLMTNLRLISIWTSAVGRRHHPQQAIATLV